MKTVSIGGPFNGTGPGDSPTRRACSSARRKDASAAEDAVRAGRFCRRSPTRAYRRPVTDDELQVLLDFYKAGRDEDSVRCRHPARPRAHPRGAELPVPHRASRRACAKPARYRLNDLDLASRLSFFLWSSVPDDELLNAAMRGTAEAIRPCSSSRCGACCAIRARTRSSKDSRRGGSS